MDDYVACFRDPASIHASCEDYRAGWTLDRAHDETDRTADRTILAPMLALWAAEYSVARSHPLETWREWAADVRGVEVPGGHFPCEESPAETANALRDFFAG
jgi:haloacetate dehalogenase